MAEGTLGDSWRLFASDGFSGEIGGDGSVFGTAGFQEIAVLDEPGSVSFDPSFNKGGDVIGLPGEAAAWQVLRIGSSVVLDDGDTFVTIPVGTLGTALLFDDGARTLRFDEIEGAIRIGGQTVTETSSPVASEPDELPPPAGADPDATGRLFLAEGGSVSAGGNLDIFGTNGAENVKVTEGEFRFDPSFNKGGDTLVLNGPASGFTIVQQGSSAVLQGEGAEIVLPVGTAGITLSLADGDRTLGYDTMLGSIMFGTQTVEQAPTLLEGAPDSLIDQVLYWNEVALDAIAQAGAIPTFATRALAIQSIAVYDAISSIGASEPLWIKLEMSGSADIAAAVAYASHTTLAELFPSQAAFLDMKLAEALPDLGTGDSFQLGQDIGTAIGQAVLALREIDGYDAVVVHESSGAPGEWVQTPPAFAAPEAPQWAYLDPFVLNSTDQFRGSPPPALDSEEYAADFNEVKELGALNSETRTEEQTEIALFWRDAVGTYTPPGHWNVVAQVAATETDGSTAENAVTFALLNVALADAAVAAWDAKYAFSSWRPITAIRNADLDGNELTVADPEWAPLFGTPPHPEDPSGHSTFSAAASAVLTARFGEAYSFDLTATGLPGVTRSFESFDEAAREAGISRIYGGIHFPYGNETGYEIGSDVGAWVVQVFSELEGVSITQASAANFSVFA